MMLQKQKKTKKNTHKLLIHWFAQRSSNLHHWPLQNLFQKPAQDSTQRFLPSTEQVGKIAPMLEESIAFLHAVAKNQKLSQMLHVFDIYVHVWVIFWDECKVNMTYMEPFGFSSDLPRHELLLCTEILLATLKPVATPIESLSRTCPPCWLPQGFGKDFLHRLPVINMQYNMKNLCKYVFVEGKQEPLLAIRQIKIKFKAAQDSKKAESCWCFMTRNNLSNFIGWSLWPKGKL